MMFAPQSQKRGGGSHAFGDHGHALQDFIQRAAFPKFKSDIAIAAERAGAGEDQIAETGESPKCFRLGSKFDGKTGHLGESPSDERRKCICAEAESLASARRDGHNIFHGAGKFHSKHILIGVKAESWACEFFLEESGERAILRCENNGGGLPPSRFQGKGRARKHGEPRNEADGENLFKDFAYPQVRGRLQALGGTYDDGFRRNLGKCPREYFARVCRREQRRRQYRA